MSHRSFITPFCATLAASSLTGCEPGSGGIGTAGGSTFLVSTSSTSTLDSFVLVDLFPDGVYAQQRVEASWTRETDDGMARPSWRFACCSSLAPVPAPSPASSSLFLTLLLLLHGRT